MRRFIALLAAAGTLALFALTLVLAIVSTRVAIVAGKAQPQPQALSLADLVEHGAGDNLHVTVSGFTVEPPIVDQFADKWDGAWIPLYVPGTKTKGSSPAAFFYARRVRSRPELNELLKYESYTGLVVSELPDSALKYTPAVQVYSTYPKLDPQKTIVLTDPVLIFGPDTVLPPEKWFSGFTAPFCWGTTVIALFAAIGCALLSYRMSQKADSEALPPRKLAPSKLVNPADPNVISVHRFTLERSYFVIGAFGLAMVCMFVVGLVLMQVALRMYLEGSAAALLMALLGLLMSAGGVGLGIKLVYDYFFTVREVAVLHDGIRWLRNKRTYNAPLTDIKSVFQKDLVYVASGGTRSGQVHTLTIYLFNGQTLRFSYETLEDYDRFIEHLQGIHSRWALQRKERELVAEGAAKFGPVIVSADGVTLKGKKVPWYQLERFQVTDGHLKIHASNIFRFVGSRSIPLHEIPNYLALIEMLRPKVAAG